MQHRPDSIEWPTIFVAVAILGLFGGGFAASASGYTLLSAILFLTAGAWYGSLQHEVVHGHPTPWNAVNLAIGSAPFGLLFPFADYKRTHLAHHNDDSLTDPSLDPESRYVSRETWLAAGPVLRKTLSAERSLLGWMTIGAIRKPLSFWFSALQPSNPRRLAGAEVIRHLVGVVIILSIVSVSTVPVWFYILFVGYGGLAAMLLRSFAEHKAVTDGCQAAVVRAGPFFSLLFLNNNLHATHHLLPGAPWWTITSLHEAAGSDERAAAGAGLYVGGYREIASRYLFRSFEQPLHPIEHAAERC